MSITGEPDGQPMKVGVAMVDVLTGLHAAVAILAAVHRGEGDQIEVSLLDSGLAGLINVASNVLVAGGEPQRHGNAHPNIVPYQSFPTAEGWIAIAAPNDGLYQRLCEALGAPELAGDERFVTNSARVENRETLIPLIEQRLASKTAEEWLTALEEPGRPGRQDPQCARGAASSRRGRPGRHDEGAPPHRGRGGADELPDPDRLRPPPTHSPSTAGRTHSRSAERNRPRRRGDRAAKRLGRDRTENRELRTEN